MSGKRKNGRGKRYTTAEKIEVVKFVKDYNAKHGRGGQNQAAKKFVISQLTVASWLRSTSISAASSTSSTAKGRPSAADLMKKIKALLELSDQLRKHESEGARLRVKYESIKSSILGDL